MHTALCRGPCKTWKVILESGIWNLKFIHAKLLPKQVTDIHDFASSYAFLSHGYLRIRRFSMQLVCLPMGFDHSKFQPRCVSHHRRGAVRHTRRRHN